MSGSDIFQQTIPSKKVNEMKGALIQQYEEMHAEAAAGKYHFPGRSVLMHAWIINQMIRKSDNPVSSLLDYGCGLGLQYSVEHVQNWWGIQPVLYDPAVPNFAQRPTQKFDGVICSDVMEHIPRDEVGEVIEDVYSYATQWVFFSICCRPASRTLPNGINAHCTLLDENEWKALLKLYGNAGIKTRLVFNP